MHCIMPFKCAHVYKNLFKAGQSWSGSIVFSTWKCIPWSYWKTWYAVSSLERVFLCWRWNYRAFSLVYFSVNLYILVYFLCSKILKPNCVYLSKKKRKVKSQFTMFHETSSNCWIQENIQTYVSIPNHLNMYLIVYPSIHLPTYLIYLSIEM